MATATYIMSFIVACDSEEAAQRWCSDSQDAVSAMGVSDEIPGAYMIASGCIARVYDGELEA